MVDVEKRRDFESDLEDKVEELALNGGILWVCFDCFEFLEEDGAVLHRLMEHSVSKLDVKGLQNPNTGTVHIKKGRGVCCRGYSFKMDWLGNLSPNVDLEGAEICDKCLSHKCSSVGYRLGRSLMR